MAKFGRAVAMELIADWLEKLGLSEYAQRFAENAIDLSTIRDLTEQDLKDIGVRLGHRRKILRAIAELNGITSSSSETATASKLPDEAERRHLTVLICDLVGSTALSSRLDPEDMRTVIDAYHAACARIMPTYEGFLAEFRGDGILAYFGYPRAHEDDAERTVRAALDIIAAVAALKTRAGHPLAVRIGIATGLVLVGNLTGHRALREHAVVGDAPNVAARLLAVAEPGTIVIAASTRRLIGDLFRLRDLGPHEVRGIAEPMASWVVEGLSASESRFESVRVSRLTDVIGRGKEIDFLLHRQRQAWKGEGQIVLISGEPGIGKSRIAAAVSERIAGEPHLRLRYQCSPYHTNSALRPFIAQLERAAGFKADDTVEERLSKIETLLALSASRVRNVAPLFASLLSIPSGDRYPPLGLSPTQQRRRTLAALLDQFERLAHQQPILLVFEDVHWADATSLELLDLTVVRMRQLQVLALVTSRPEFQPPWVGRPNATTLALGRLDRDDVETMVGRLTGGYPLPAEVMKQIVGKTDGNPLFVEELTKTVLEADILIKDAGSYRLAGPLPALAIPTTLQDSLMARLDRLAPVREISQIGAVIGREFSYTLIRAVVGRDERALKQALDQLEEAELVFRRGDPPEATYTFKHALVRDAAYESLLKSRRQQLHSQLAKVLAEKFPEIVASQPEIVAHHFTEAGLVEPAIDYWLKAGQQAMRRSANAEALNHVARGLQLLPEIENPHQRNKFELLLQISQGNSLRATKGWSVDDVKHAYTRALQLCKNSGFDEHTLSAVFGLWTWNFVHGALREALSLAEHLVRTAGNMDDPVCKVLAYEALGFTLFARGNFPASHAALERSLSFCEDGKAAVYLDLSAQDPRVHVRLYDGLALCLLGYPDLALRICAQARHYAESSQHPFSEAMARTISLRVYQFRGEATMVAEQANTAIAQCEEHDFVHYLAQALILRGWAVAQQGEFEKGLIEIQQGVDKARAAGAFLFESYTLGLQADACITNKRYEQAFEFLKQAELRLDQENSERFYAAEIYRLFGEACVRSDRPLDLAEHYFRKGLTIASEQTAKLFELRLSLSIYDFYQQKQGEKNYCLQLDKIYRSFSEGFDATDLVKAKARLTNA